MFILPFFIIHAINIIYYDQEEGDLVRIGFLYSNACPKSSINSQFLLPKKYYTVLSELDLTTNTKFDVVIIGDSFSDQGVLGYQNFLAQKGISVLHIDGFISKDNLGQANPIQTLVGLLNSNFFDYIQTDYVVLQSVERHFNKRNEKIDLDSSMDMKKVSDKISSKKKGIKKIAQELRLSFFSNRTLNIPLTNIQYLFNPKPKYSQTYKYKLNNFNLFSNNAEEVLFYEDDYNFLKFKNDTLNVINSINAIEHISDLAFKKNIELITLISPDKYDLYYKYIKDNEKLIEPTFFSIYEGSEKRYINVNTYQILSKKIEKEKDIYFYDDTHWSPKAAEIMANEIHKILKNRMRI
jgi:hypothetical protein